MFIMALIRKFTYILAVAGNYLLTLPNMEMSPSNAGKEIICHENPREFDSTDYNCCCSDYGDNSIFFRG